MPPGAWRTCKGKQVPILDAELPDGSDGEPAGERCFPRRHRRPAGRAEVDPSALGCFAENGGLRKERGEKEHAVIALAVIVVGRQGGEIAGLETLMSGVDEGSELGLPFEFEGVVDVDEILQRRAVVRPKVQLERGRAMADQAFALGAEAVAPKIAETSDVGPLEETGFGEEARAVVKKERVEQQLAPVAHHEHVVGGAGLGGAVRKPGGTGDRLRISKPVLANLPVRMPEWRGVKTSPTT